MDFVLYFGFLYQSHPTLLYREGLLFASIFGTVLLAALDLSDPSVAKVLPVIDVYVGNIIAAVEDEKLLSLAQEHVRLADAKKIK